MSSENSALDLETDKRSEGRYWEELENPEERGAAAYAAFREIEEEQSSYREATLQHLQMYRNIERMGYGGRRGDRPITYLKVPLSLNVVRNMVNAVHSRITRNRVKAMFQTKGAGWEAKERARNGEQFGTALALKEGLYKKSPMSFMDCAVTGTGVLKTYPSKEQKRPVIERVFAPNLVVDFAEGSDITVTPAHYNEVKYFSKRVLIKRYPEKESIIKSLPAATSGDGDTFYALQESDSTDRVRVIQCLYLNPDDENEGVISIVANGHELTGGPWKTGDPYSVMRWSNSPLGWYGMGLAEELKGIQSEINRLVRKIQNSMALLGNPYVFADRSANIVRQQLTDIPGTVILYNGKQPNVQAPQTVHPEMFAHLDRLYQRAYEIAGISQLSAHGQKPGGVESGRAMLVYDDIQDSDRFANVHREWSDMHADAITKAIKATKAISGYKVSVYGSDSREEMTHKDLSLEGDDSWVIHPQPASLLGDTPTGQIDMTDKLHRMGIIDDPADYLAEVAAPDEAALLKRKSAPKRLIERTVGLMLSKGEYNPPEPNDNLALAQETANEMYEEARLDDYPRERLDLVLEYQLAVKDLIDKAAGNTSAAGGAGGPPMAPQDMSQPPQGMPPMGGMMPPGGAPPMPPPPGAAPPPPM